MSSKFQKGLHGQQEHLAESFPVSIAIQKAKNEDLELGLWVQAPPVFLFVVIMCAYVFSSFPSTAAATF